MEAALKRGLSVVVDNTNPTPEDRVPLLELGRQYGAKVVGYHFDSDVRECIGRNEKRDDKVKVPEVAIYATAKKLVPPTHEEGFDELFGVHIVGDSGFEVGAVWM